MYSIENRKDHRTDHRAEAIFVVGQTIIEYSQKMYSVIFLNTERLKANFVVGWTVRESSLKNVLNQTLKNQEGQRPFLS